VKKQQKDLFWAGVFVSASSAITAIITIIMLAIWGSQPATASDDWTPILLSGISLILIIASLGVFSVPFAAGIIMMTIAHAKTRRDENETRQATHIPPQANSSRDKRHDH